MSKVTSFETDIRPLFTQRDIQGISKDTIGYWPLFISLKPRWSLLKSGLALFEMYGKMSGTRNRAQNLCSGNFQWGRVMSAKEFREYANECMEWAKSAKTDKERDIFLQMARTWSDAALVAREREMHSPPISNLAQPSHDKDGTATA